MVITHAARNLVTTSVPDLRSTVPVALSLIDAPMQKNQTARIGTTPVMIPCVKPLKYAGAPGANVRQSAPSSSGASIRPPGIRSMESFKRMASSRCLGRFQAARSIARPGASCHHAWRLNSHAARPVAQQILTHPSRKLARHPALRLDDDARNHPCGRERGPRARATEGATGPRKRSGIKDRIGTEPLESRPATLGRTHRRSNGWIEYPARISQVP